MPLFRDERERGRDLPGRKATELLGGAGDVLAIRPEDRARVLGGEEQRPAVDVRERVQAKLERRDDAEVPAAAAERPEQILVLALARDERPIGGDDLGREEVVAREAGPPRQVADAAAEREPAHAGRGHDASGRREAVSVRRPFGLNPFNAVGAALTSALDGYEFDPEAYELSKLGIDTCPLDNHGDMIPPA